LQYLYYTNFDVVLSGKEIVWSLLLTTGFISLLLGLGYLVFRDWHRSALITGFITVLVFSYGYAKDLVGVEDGGLLVVWGLLLVLFIVVVLLYRRSSGFPTVTVVGNVVSLAIVVVVLVGIGVSTLESGSGTPYVSGNPYSIDWGKVERRPDIYYLQPDRYTNEYELVGLDFDNSEFISFLESRGFYVVHSGCCNYPRTAFSCASSLNMFYLDSLFTSTDAKTNTDALWLALKNGEVSRLLKSGGYTYISVESWALGGPENPYADISYLYEGEIPFLPTTFEFGWVFYKTTAFYPILEKVFPSASGRMHMRNLLLYQFNILGEIPNGVGPTFTHAHFMCPHNPYMFDTDGSFPTGELIRSRTIEENTLAQMPTINGMLMDLVDTILAESDEPPIIIIQADEGIFTTEAKQYTDSGGLGECMDPESLKLRMGIINAYYLPDGGNELLYEDITPVNSFRLIFNHYFGADFELLPDRVYSVGGGVPPRFIDVTEVVKGK